MIKWEESLEIDSVEAEASRKAGGGKGKGKSKKRVYSDDEDDDIDDEFDYKPVKKVRAPVAAVVVKKKASVPLPDSDDEILEVSVPVKAKEVAKVVVKEVVVAKLVSKPTVAKPTVVKAPVIKKKRSSSTFSAEDEQPIAGPSKIKKKPKVSSFVGFFFPFLLLMNFFSSCLDC